MACLPPALTLTPQKKTASYYLWSSAELQSLLSADQRAPFFARFGIDSGSDNAGAHWHLHGHRAWADVASDCGLTAMEASSRVEAALDILRATRIHRRTVRRNISTRLSWNALAIRGLAIAGRALQRVDYTEAAETTLAALRDRHVIGNKLCRIGTENSQANEALLDDYAALLDATLEVLASEWRDDHLKFAIWLAETLIERFSDPASGGLWLTPVDSEDLIMRPKWYADETIPSGNGLASRSLLRLGYLTGTAKYITIARGILCSAHADIVANPTTHATLLDTLEEIHDPTTIVILRGPATLVAKWHRELARIYAPRRLVFAIPDRDEPTVAFLSNRPSSPSGIAYVYHGLVFKAAITHFTELAALLRDGIEVEDN